jgi:hypothetical protein
MTWSLITHARSASLLSGCRSIQSLIIGLNFSQLIAESIKAKRLPFLAAFSLDLKEEVVIE